MNKYVFENKLEMKWARFFDILKIDYKYFTDNKLGIGNYFLFNSSNIIVKVDDKNDKNNIKINSIKAGYCGKLIILGNEVNNDKDFGLEIGYGYDYDDYFGEDIRRIIMSLLRNQDENIILFTSNEEDQNNYRDVGIVIINFVLTLNKFNKIKENKLISNLLKNIEEKDYKENSISTALVLKLSKNEKFKKEMNNVINSLENKEKFIDMLITNSFDQKKAMLNICKNCKKTVITVSLQCIYCFQECYGSDNNKMVKIFNNLWNSSI